MGGWVGDGTGVSGICAVIHFHLSVWFSLSDEIVLPIEILLLQVSYRGSRRVRWVLDATLLWVYMFCKFLWGGFNGQFEAFTDAIAHCLRQLLYMHALIGLLS